MDRRIFSAMAAGALAQIATGTFAQSLSPPATQQQPAKLPGGKAGTGAWAARAREIEAATGGRLGIAIHFTGSGRRFSHRGAERFPMCSTFKTLASAYVLHRVDKGQEQLDRRISFTRADLVRHAPAVEAKLAEGSMTLAELCEGTITLSDNAAANLILATYGGPAALTRYLRSIGDKITRADRTEPELNTAIAGDPRDTTTPETMIATIGKLVLGDALSPASRDQLTRWLVANKTGDTRLRAGLAPGWRVGDKTGTGANGTNNDAGVLWTPQGEPVLIAAYLTGAKVPMEQQNAAIAAVAALAVSMG
ncbi:MAG: class A beta-lactamase [Burkholderiaceae bacterium]